MSYEVAINKAWENLGQFKPDNALSVKFLADEYIIDYKNRGVSSSSCNIPAKEHLEILILHYLFKKLNGLPPLSGEWVSFKELENGEFYYPAFRKRAIEPILRKYGGNPNGLLSALEKLPADKASQGDVSVIFQVFEGVPMMVILWKGDEEFSPEANLLFDRSIAQIYGTEDIAVLAGFVAKHI